MKFAGYDFDDKFIVLKRAEVVKHLSPKEQEYLWYLTQKIGHSRKSQGKRAFNNYLAVNIDEPYADQIADIIASHHDVKRIENDEQCKD